MTRFYCYYYCLEAILKYQTDTGTDISYTNSLAIWKSVIYTATDRYTCTDRRQLIITSVRVKTRIDNSFVCRFQIPFRTMRKRNFRSAECRSLIWRAKDVWKPDKWSRRLGPREILLSRQTIAFAKKNRKKNHSRQMLLRREWTCHRVPTIRRPKSESWRSVRLASQFFWNDRRCQLKTQNRNYGFELNATQRVHDKPIIQ